MVDPISGLCFGWAFIPESIAGYMPGNRRRAKLLISKGNRWLAVESR